MNTSRRGDIAEHLAIAYLLHQGYEVFHNTACTGVADMMVMTPDNRVIPVDVKRAGMQNNVVYIHNVVSNTKALEHHKVMLLYVFINDDTFESVVHTDESAFYELLHQRGYTTKHNSRKYLQVTQYTVREHSSGNTQQVLGRELLSALLGTDKQYPQQQFLANKLSINGYEFVSSARVRVYKDEHGHYIQE